MNAIFRRELRAFFTNPIGYVVLAVLFAISGFFFFSYNLLGGSAKAEGDTIVIQGVKALRGGVKLPSYNDHRMVMLGMIAASIAEEPVVVSGVEALNKSWPEFVNVYQNLGGKAE